VPTNQIGRELNVEHILEGSVRKQGNDVRITAQLIQVADGFHLWSDTYTRTLEGSIFSIQDDVASRILTELLNRMITVDSSCDCCKTENLKAFNLYAEGRHHWNKRAESEIEKGIECFKKALKEDPEFSLAYTGLIDSWILLVHHGHTKREILLPQCWDALHKAEELGDTSAELYTSHAAILELEDKDEEAIEHFITAIEQNPNYATAHHWLAVQYHNMHEYEKATEQIEMAMTLDPKSAIIHCFGAFVYLTVGNPDKALALYKQTSNISPGYLGVECSIGQILKRQYKWEEAEKYYADLLKSDYYINNNNNKLILYFNLFDLYLTINKKDKAIKISKLIENVEDKLIEPIQIKIKYIHLAMNYFYLSQPKKSLKYYTHLLEMHPNEEWDAFTKLDLANCLIYMKDFEKAFEILQETDKIEGSLQTRRHKIRVDFEIKYSHTLSMIMNKDIENAYVSIHKMKEMDKNIIHHYYYNLFSLYFFLNDLDSGYKWYYKELEEKKKPCFSIIYDPWCENARKDGRYIDLLKEMKLYDYWKDSL
jgi:tetratricopeptide (TPR) repeat protein